ncbi:MAG: AMP-binding protein, partial [Prevotella sp.]|nr:AMP-binding protein [Prevotella sp.]
MDTNCDDILLVLHKVSQTYPDHIAVVEGDNDTLTYRQLWQQARRVSKYIKLHSEGCDFVGLHLPKSSSYIISMIGCWMSGKAFVPIGTDLPPIRRQYIAAHADIALCLDKDSFSDALSYPMEDAIAPCQPHNPAYIIYSSGSTGTPNGILVGHSGLCKLA